MAIRRRLVLSISALMAAVAIGCGGETALSPDAYRAEADRLCTDYAQAITEIQTPERVDGIAGALAAVGPIVEGLADDLDELRPPDELKGDHERVIDLLREQVEITDAGAKRIDQGEEPGAVITELEPRLSAIETEADAAAAAMGLSVCGQDG